MRSVAEKMGVRPNSKALFVNAPKVVIQSLDLPDVEFSEQLTGGFDYIHLFVTRQVDQEDLFPKLKSKLKSDGMLWVSWPKGGQLDTDLSLPKVIKIGYDFGLVESTCLSIDSVWSGLKFTHPKKGKVYNNSHAQLKSRTTER
ncbi:hypothetical protein [Dyadobacter alkalitolerans]|uniref:hypothetical protein n=1 Tax=Dyadobacter alkalitolerans TaxID=492736 RepID=UPI00047E3669|nr:hypothetical protein [Dyadobacter alkalitolerans]